MDTFDLSNTKWSHSAEIHCQVLQEAIQQEQGTILLLYTSDCQPCSLGGYGICPGLAKGFDLCGHSAAGLPQYGADLQLPATCTCR